MQVKRNPARVPEAVTEVYKGLQWHLENGNVEEQHHLRSLEAERSVWTGRCFIDPASAALDGDQSLAPALYHSGQCADS